MTLVTCLGNLFGLANQAVLGILTFAIDIVLVCILSYQGCAPTLLL